MVSRFTIEREGRKWRILAAHTGDSVLPWRAWATSGNGEWLQADGDTLRAAMSNLEVKIEERRK